VGRAGRSDGLGSVGSMWRPAGPLDADNGGDVVVHPMREDSSFTKERLDRAVANPLGARSFRMWISWFWLLRILTIVHCYFIW
jgi:hypothetical protein